MPNFYRTVDLVALAGKYLNSPSLAAIFERIAARQFNYLVEITHYAPAIEGWNHSPDNQFADEPEELEFRPEYDLSYIGKVQLMGFLKGSIWKYHQVNPKTFSNLLFYWKVRLIFWFFEENIYEGFTQHEEDWIRREISYKQALDVARKLAFDPD